MLIPNSVMWEQMRRKKLMPFELEREENDLDFVRIRRKINRVKLATIKHSKKQHGNIIVGAARRDIWVNRRRREEKLLDRIELGRSKYMGFELYGRKYHEHAPMLNLHMVNEHQNQGIAAVPGLLEVLASPVGEKEYSVMVLGNISLQSLDARDFIVDRGGLELIQQLMPQFQQADGAGGMPQFPLAGGYVPEQSMFTTLSWCLFHLLRPPSLPVQMILPLLPSLSHLLRAYDDRLRADISWILAFVSDGSEEISQAIIDGGFVPILLNLLRTKRARPMVLEPTLRVLGYIARGNLQRIEFLVDNGLLHEIYHLITEPIKSEWNEEVTYSVDRSCLHIACWIIVQVIEGGGIQQVQAMIDAHLLEPLIRLTLAENPIKEEAALAICHAAVQASAAQVQTMVEEEVVTCICSLLSLPIESLGNQIYTEACIRALTAILNAHAESGERVADCGVWFKIKGLSKDGNSPPEIRALALALIQGHWHHSYDTRYQQFLKRYSFSTKLAL